MRAVLQRVSRASVRVDADLISEIGPGYLVLLGVSSDDTPDAAQWLARKILDLRLFPAEDGSSGFDQSVVAVGGEILVVSQFTLYSDVRKGRRPAFTRAAPPGAAESLVEATVDALREGYAQARIFTGKFGAKMDVELLNDGPVTLIIEAPQ